MLNKESRAFGPERRGAGAHRKRAVPLFLVLLMVMSTVVLAPQSADAAQVTCFGRVATIVSNAAVVHGTDGYDVIVGGSASQTIYGGGGRDIICGKAGNDTIYGNTGRDLIEGGQGHDAINGGKGDDEIYGNSGYDSLHGKEGNDILDGGAGNDRIYGQEGNDTIRGGTENDHIWGYGGNDTIDAGIGNDVVNGGDGDDTIVGNQGNDSLAGANGNDLVNGNNGDDRLYGQDGNDRLFGDAGNDRLYGQDGHDTMHGGHGDDYVFGYPGDDQLFGDAGVDRLYGHDGNDTLHGGEGIDYLYGYPGDDQLFGDAGADRLYGHDGNDTLRGGDGNDYLYGYAGNDVLNGDVGTDYARGDEGTDTCIAETVVTCEVASDTTPPNWTDPFVRVESLWRWDFTLVWGTIDDPDASFEVEITNTNGAYVLEVFPSSVNSWKVETFDIPFEPHEVYNVRVSAVDRSGNRSTWHETIVQIPVLGPPSLEEFDVPPPEETQAIASLTNGVSNVRFDASRSDLVGGTASGTGGIVNANFVAGRSYQSVLQVREGPDQTTFNSTGGHINHYDSSGGVIFYPSDVRNGCIRQEEFGLMRLIQLAKPHEGNEDLPDKIRHQWKICRMVNGGDSWDGEAGLQYLFPLSSVGWQEQISEQHGFVVQAVGHTFEGCFSQPGDMVECDFRVVGGYTYLEVGAGLSASNADLGWISSVARCSGTLFQVFGQAYATHNFPQAPMNGFDPCIP